MGNAADPYPNEGRAEEPDPMVPTWRGPLPPRHRGESPEVPLTGLRFTLERAEGGLLLSRHRPDILDGVVALRLFAIACVIAATIFSFTSGSRRPTGEGSLAFLLLFLTSSLVIYSGEVHTIVARLNRRSALRRVQRSFQIRAPGNTPEVWVDGRREPAPRYLAVVMTRAKNESGRMPLAYGVCLVFADGLLMVDDLRSVEAASELAEILRLSLRLDHPPLVGEVDPVWHTNAFVLVSLPIVLAELCLVIFLGIWADGVVMREAAAPLLFLGADMVAQEVLVRGGRWANARQVRGALKRQLPIPAQTYR